MNSIKEFIKMLKQERKSATVWFKMNDTIANSEKFKTMIVSCGKKEDKYNLNLNNSIII